jgi:hypothetical protein
VPKTTTDRKSVGDPHFPRQRAGLLLKQIVRLASWLLVLITIAVTDSAAVERSVPSAGSMRSLHSIRIEGNEALQMFENEHLMLLEKLNRADIEHLARLRDVVVPSRWDTSDLAYTPLPLQYPCTEMYSKVIIVDQPWQVFGAYENGILVRWGPVSSGRASSPTPAGYFHLTWKTPGRHSTINPQWYMPWYFNFHNERGLAFHDFALPGHPASHACIRLLSRDARWLFAWGEQWHLDDGGTEILEAGTPILILGNYDFNAAPPWRSWQGNGPAIDLPCGEWK